MQRPRFVVLPDGRAPRLADAIRDGGGEVVATDRAEAIVWADPADPHGLRDALDAHRDIGWVQLPYAGVEPFAEAGVFDHDRIWTCGKGVYAEPVAEHALGLALAGMRGIVSYARERTWSSPYGVNLLGAKVTVLGGGAITRSLLRLLSPFGAEVTVVRKHPDPLEGAAEVLGIERLHDGLASADLVMVALALTPETEGLIGAAELAAMPEHAWLVNVARGRHVDTDALVEALREERIGGAALDVTDPEPLPDDHPLWTLPRAMITPHVGNTPEMGEVLLAARVRDNVERYAAGRELLGGVDVDLGY